MTIQLGIRRNSLWAVVEVLLSALILFLLYKIVAQRLGVEDLGVWSLVMATTSLGRLADIGSAAGLSRYVAAARAKNEQELAVAYAETAVLTNLVLYLAIAVIIWAPAHYGLSLMTTGTSLLKARILLPYALLSFVLMNVTAATTGALVGQQRSDQRSMVTIAGLVVQCTVALYFVPRAGLPALAWAQTAQFFLLATISWVLFLKNQSGRWTLRFPLHWRKQAFVELFGFGMKLQAVSIISFLYEPTVKFLLSALGGLATLGFYEMALRIVMQVRQLIALPIQPLTPGFAHLQECEPEEVGPLYRKAMAMTVATGLPLLAGVAAASPLISWLWIGQVELIFVALTALLALGWFANLLSAPAFLLGMGLGYLRGNFCGWVLTMTGTVVMSFIGGHLFGSLGVIIPALTMLAAGSLLTMVMNCKMAHIPPLPQLADFRALLDEALSYIKRRQTR